MVRQIIKIDEEKCTGCGLCATACHEGAIVMTDGKARLLRDDYCDGMGDCLPACPRDAISFENREATAYDELAVLAKKNKPISFGSSASTPKTFACPGTNVKSFDRNQDLKSMPLADTAESRLENWPVQIKLAPVRAKYFENANLLIAADCSAFTYGNFHNDFIRNHIVIIGCPKLDSVDYSEKLTQIISLNNIKSVKIVRMEVPCCGGLENAAKKAIQQSDKVLPCSIITISTDGRVLEE